MSAAEAVGNYTNLYVRLGMGPRFDPENPVLVEYASKLATAKDRVAWTYEVHCRRSHLHTGPELTASVGCFSYAVLGPTLVRLHFHASSERVVRRNLYEYP